jgi:hypothetical protein
MFILFKEFYRLYQRSTIDRFLFNKNAQKSLLNLSAGRSSVLRACLSLRNKFRYNCYVGTVADTEFRTAKVTSIKKM